LNHLTSIFLTLIFLIGGNFAVANNQVSSASLGVLSTFASQKEFLTADHTDTTDKSGLDRQVAENAKVFKTSLEPMFRDSISLHSFSISASLGDLCALAANLSSRRTTTGPITQIIPSQSQSFTVNDRLTTDTYDANGNTTSSLITDHGSLGTNASDVYSFDNKLIRRTTPDGKTIDLTYNPDGHRLSKFITQNGLTQRLVHYLTDSNNPTGYAQVIEEKQPLDTANPLKKVNLYGHDLITTESRSVGVSPTSSIFYNYDGLGSVRSILNETGDLQETYDYDAYGTLIGLVKRNPTTGLLESSNLSSTIPNPQSDYLYTGEQWDADLGMYFLRARYLNTHTGRFHSQDIYEGGSYDPISLHKFTYASNNPVMYRDPSGNITLTETSLVQSINTALDKITFAFRGYEFYEKVQTAIDIFNTVKAIAEVIGNPTELLKYSSLLATQAVDDSKFREVISPEGLLEGVGVLTQNSPRIISTLLSRPIFVKGILSKNVKGFLIDMPSPPIGLRKLGLPLIPTGIKIKGEPVSLNFRPKAGRFLGVSIQQNGGNPQIFRMDYHDVHDSEDWESHGYHFHVGGKK
jgi:RHS repeat-associated protein